MSRVVVHLRCLMCNAIGEYSIPCECDNDESFNCICDRLIQGTYMATHGCEPRRRGAIRKIGFSYSTEDSDTEDYKISWEENKP